MRKYSSNLAFVDLLFNMLVGFTCLFVIAFLMINPIAKQGTIDPPVMLMIEMEWNPDSNTDIDLWVNGPDGHSVGFSSRENGYITLKRDDLGKINDRYTVNGEVHTIRRNYEIITMTALPDGDYTVNVHYFSGNGPVEPVNIKITNLAHFDIAFEDEQDIDVRQEITFVTFKIKDNKVVDIRTDVQVGVRARSTRL